MLLRSGACEKNHSGLRGCRHRRRRSQLVDGVKTGGQLVEEVRTRAGLLLHTMGVTLLDDIVFQLLVAKGDVAAMIQMAQGAGG